MWKLWKTNYYWRKNFQNFHIHTSYMCLNSNSKHVLSPWHSLFILVEFYFFSKICEIRVILRSVIIIRIVIYYVNMKNYKQQQQRRYLKQIIFNNVFFFKYIFSNHHHSENNFFVCLFLEIFFFKFSKFFPPLKYIVEQINVVVFVFVCFFFVLRENLWFFIWDSRCDWKMVMIASFLKKKKNLIRLII